MKECWINVYFISQGITWQGYCYSKRYGSRADGVVYRIHVRYK